MLGDAVNDEAQTSLRSKAVELGRTDLAIEGVGPLALGIRTREQEALPTQGDRTQSAFRNWAITNLRCSISGLLLADLCLE